MTPIRFIAAFLVATAAPVAHGAPAAPERGLCSAGEAVYFACRTSPTRWISLCGKSPRDLQYRFGKPGRVELSYPAQAENGAKSFLFAHYFRYRTDRIEIRFDHQGVEYLLFDFVEDARAQAGVVVTIPPTDAKGTPAEREINCTGTATSRLGELKDTIPCDTDNALSGGLCR